jgi:Fic-DOC domain mobile mystery protein B
MIMMNFDYPPGATPLDMDEAEGLLLPHITTRSELDRWEQENITEADAWAFRRKPKDLLSMDFACQLHKRMFGTVWRWAGKFRTSDKNIGVAYWSIAQALINLLEDVKIWVEQTVYPSDEIAARFHHRLVSIHLFANGNGRHARLMADLLLVHVLNRPRFTWGSENLVQAGTCRKQYISALQAADRHDYEPLMQFVRS